MNTKRRKIFISLLLFSFILMMTFSPLSSRVMDDHDTLIVQLDQEIVYMDNRVRGRTGPAQDAICNQIWGYLGMMVPGESAITTQSIAESWYWNSDRTAVTFTLREGLTFHDGTPITASDIEYSWKSGWIANGRLDNTSDPQWNDEFNFSYASDDSLIFTVESTTYFPDIFSEFDFCGGWEIRAIIPEGCYDTEQEIIDFEQKPISCGPYMLASASDWISNESVILTRFDDWFGWGKSFTASNGQIYTFPTVENSFKYINFQVITETSSAALKLITNEIDIVTSQFTNITSFEDSITMEGYSGYIIPISSGSRLNFNHQGSWPSYFGGPGNFPCNENWFKRAISHAIDRQDIVDTAYNGIAEIRDKIFPSWILDNFDSIDTSNFYDFSKNDTKAIEILDSSGYTALGFLDEPDNRFGWGTYKNETSIDSVEQTKGYHFNLITMDCEACIERALSIRSSLANMGIYVDIEILEWANYLDKFYEGMEGSQYNTSYIDDPDPDFTGPSWDFNIGGFSGLYSIPWDVIAYKNFLYWYFYGYGGYSWYNENFEIGYAKATGGEPGFGLLNIPNPPDMPSNGYIIPEISNNDTQFIEGVVLAGSELASELPDIPLIWYVNTYAFNEYVDNFIVDHLGKYHLAYCFWDDGTVTTTTITTTSSTSTTTTITTTSSTSTTTTSDLSTTVEINTSSITTNITAETTSDNPTTTELSSSISDTSESSSEMTTTEEEITTKTTTENILVTPGFDYLYILLGLACFFIIYNKKK